MWQRHFYWCQNGGMVTPRMPSPHLTSSRMVSSHMTSPPRSYNKWHYPALDTSPHQYKPYTKWHYPALDTSPQCTRQLTHDLPGSSLACHGSLQERLASDGLFRLSAFLPFSLSAFQPFSLSAFQPFSLSAFQPFSLSAFQPFSLSAFQPFSYSKTNFLVQIKFITQD